MNKCKFECMASYEGTNGPASVVYGKCPYDVLQKDCAQHCIFTNMVADFQANGDAPAAAIWKAHIILKVPTAYDIGGEIKAWRETYRPASVPAIEEKQKAFINSLETKGTVIVKHCAPPEREQISIWEVLEHGHD